MSAILKHKNSNCVFAEVPLAFISLHCAACHDYYGQQLEEKKKRFFIDYHSEMQRVEAKGIYFLPDCDKCSFGGWGRRHHIRRL